MKNPFENGQSRFKPNQKKIDQKGCDRSRRGNDRSRRRLGPAQNPGKPCRRPSPIENTLTAAGEVLPAFEEVIASSIQANIREVLLPIGSEVNPGTPIL